MKKMLILSLILTISIVFVGCSSGSSPDDGLTMENLTKAYTDAGAELKEEKPLFSMIEAKDGVMVYLNNSPVKLYEYASASEIESFKKENELIKDWPSRGKFLLETSKQEAIDIFNKVE
ncbi:hypothetical protein BK129_14895 [Paenibacillus amylolyticus]|nr:hypothetical protein BK129_14895 [Paenibacillus amylolyticus]